MISKAKLYRFLYLVAIFLLIYAPFLSIRGITIHFPYLFTFVCSVVFIFTILRRGVVSKIYLTFMLLYWVGGIWAFVVGLYNHNIDKSILFTYLTGSLSLFAVYPVVDFFSKKIHTDNVVFIIRAIYVSAFVHAVIMILAFFVPLFRNILYSIVPLGVKGEVFVESMVRSPGLTTGGGDALSVIQAVGLIFGIYYFVDIRREFSLYSFFKHIISFLILLLSILLSARTGLVLLFLFIVGLLFYKLFIAISRSTISRSLFLKVSFAIGLFLIIVPIGYNYLMQSEYSRFARRAFELYINYIETGEIGTSSSNKVQDMYFLPKDKVHLYFGDGNFGRDDDLPYIDSDIGYIRTIYGVGIVGTIIMFMPLFYLLFVAIKSFKLNRYLSQMLVVLIVILLITNLKVFHYFEFRESFRVLFLLIAALTVLKVQKYKTFNTYI